MAKAKLIAPLKVRQRLDATPCSAKNVRTGLIVRYYVDDEAVWIRPIGAGNTWIERLELSEFRAWYE